MNIGTWNLRRLARRAIAGGLIGLGLGLAGCHPEVPPSGAAAQLPVVAVRVQAASAGTHRTVEDVVGTVRARVRAVIEAKVGGRISAISVAPGQQVKAGDVLVEVDAQEILARLEQAKAVLQQADRELVRFGTLLRQEAVTRAEHDAVESRQRVARAALQEAETMRGYTRVVAPFDGVVSRKLAEVGDQAAPGRGLLEIEDPASLRFEGDVPLALADRVKLGDRLKVTVGGAGTVLEGVVGEIEPTADPVSRTFRVKLDLPAGVGLRAGAFGRMAVPGAESLLLTVPAAAVRVRGQMEVVFVAAEGRARLRIVRTGKRLGTDVEILAGLEAGESVITEGLATEGSAGGVPGPGPGPADRLAGVADGQPVEVR